MMKNLNLLPLSLLWIGMAAGAGAAESETPPSSAPSSVPAPSTPANVSTPEPIPAPPVRTDVLAADEHVADYLTVKTGKEMTFTLDNLVKDGPAGVVAIMNRMRREAVRPTPNRESINRLNHALIKIGKLSLVPVVAAFRDPTEPETYRAEMARVLGRLQGYRSVYALVEVLADSMGRNPSPLASRILEALGDLSDPRPFPSIERALIHPDPSVRFAAATAMGKLADPTAFPPLLSALDDPDLAVRAAANRALIRLSGVDLSYSADMPDPQRKASIEKWRGWWTKNRAKLKPPLDPLQAELWRHADDLLGWAVSGTPFPGLKKEIVFPGPKIPAANSMIVSTAGIPNGTIPVVEGRRVLLRSPESLTPVPIGGFWRFDPPRVEENRAEWSLTHLVPGRKVQTAVLKYNLTPDAWQIEDILLSEGLETPMPPLPTVAPAAATGTKAKLPAVTKTSPQAKPASVVKPVSAGKKPATPAPATGTKKGTTPTPPPVRGKKG